jgi:WD40 repeat protein
MYVPDDWLIHWDGRRKVNICGGDMWVIDCKTKARLWIVQNYYCKFEMYFRSMAISNDGMRLITGSESRQVDIWDFDTGCKIAEYVMSGDVIVVSVSSDDRLIT